MEIGKNVQNIKADRKLPMDTVVMIRKSRIQRQKKHVEKIKPTKSANKRDVS